MHRANACGGAAGAVRELDEERNRCIAELFDRGAGLKSFARAHGLEEVGLGPAQRRGVCRGGKPRLQAER